MFVGLETQKAHATVQTVNKRHLEGNEEPGTVSPKNRNKD